MRRNRYHSCFSSRSCSCAVRGLSGSTRDYAFCPSCTPPPLARSPSAHRRVSRFPCAVRARQPGHFLETGSLTLPLAALRLLPLRQGRFSTLLLYPPCLKGSARSAGRIYFLTAPRFSARSPPRTAPQNRPSQPSPARHSAAHAAWCGHRRRCSSGTPWPWPAHRPGGRR